MPSNRYRGVPYPGRTPALLPWKAGDRSIQPPTQPGLFPDPPPVPVADHASAEPEFTPAPIWLQRASLVVLVLFCIYLGGMVVILPWWKTVWDHNALLTAHPKLWAVLMKAPVRGVISGLGLLDIWIGISEAIHYRDQRP